MPLLYKNNRVSEDLAVALENKVSMVPKETLASLDHRELKENAVSLVWKVFEVIPDCRVFQETTASMVFLDHQPKEDLQ